LTDNNFTDIPSNSLRDLAGLRGLNIGRNPFETIKSNSLRFLSKLKHLDISGCSRLTEIASNAFAGCVDLEYVTISLNKGLTRIAPDAFDAVPALRHLNLADNKLRHLPETLVPWRHLRSLDLSGNPWQCDCDLVFVPQVLKHLREKAEQGLNNSIVTDEALPVTDAPNNLVEKVVAGNCATPESQHSVSLHDFRVKCPTGNSYGTATTLSDSRDGYDVTQNDYNSNNGVDVLRDNNATAVIISVSVVVVVLTLAVTLFICVKCRAKYRDWAKRYRLWRHSAEASPGASSTGSAATKSSSLRRPPQYADHFYYPSPYRHQQSTSTQGPGSSHYSPYSPYYTQQHGQYGQGAGSAALSASDDEYYYVSTSLRGGGDTSAKHIPVTVL